MNPKEEIQVKIKGLRKDFGYTERPLKTYNSYLKEAGGKDKFYERYLESKS